MGGQNGNLAAQQPLISGAGTRASDNSAGDSAPKNLSAWIPEGTGTADAILLARDSLTIVDFKFGWIPVDASGLQLKIYAIGAWTRLHEAWEEETGILTNQR